MEAALAGLSSNRKLVVGIDFGTTYSGIARSETRRPDFQTIINAWPSHLNTHEDKSPEKVSTERRYTTAGTEWDYKSPILLNDTSGLSFPAIWSEVAKEKTLAAWNATGLNPKSNVMLVSEPEAAVTYALHGLVPHGLKIGDSFVLCDAGGGTVDLISYTITQLHPKLEIKEITPGTGGLCGSIFLNRRFAEFLDQKLGGESNWDAELQANAMEPGIPNNAKLGIRRGRLLVTPAEMQMIFEPVISEVINLVQGQIETSSREIRALLLVGGFGENSYLKERLREVLPKTIEVMQPPQAWTAVARGAVMISLGRAQVELATVAVKSRAARNHYGIELGYPYNENIHEESKK